MKYGVIIFILWLIPSFYVQSVCAQEQDSLRLDFDKLNWRDITSDQNLSTSTKVISGSRSEKSVEDLPFPIYIITSEEIQKNGYLTLTDALKRLPGIRVSQPGSALEGETFLMRGLQGNAYAKILINDVPIKPFVVSGMPIGAQLPIREAERIEVIYGPVATLYGTDASAGVINIILKGSERPIYTQADIGMGGFGFRNLDLMFGGKTGKDKNVLSFRVFGNYTSYEDQKIKYDLDSLYNTQSYQTFWGAEGFSYIDRPNYKGTITSPTLAKLPHFSNALGIELNYKKWDLSYLHMYRRDHSSISLSPLAVSYANPNNFVGESIGSGHLTYKTNIKKLRFNAALKVLTYRTDEQSSYSYVSPGTYLIQQVATGVFPSVADSLSRVIDDTFYTGSRFSAAASIEGEAEVLLGYNINTHLEMAGGLSLRRGIGYPLINFGSEPLNIDIKSIIKGNTDVDLVSYTDLSAFIESYLHVKKWTAILGAQIYKRTNDFQSRERPLLNPRIAVQYKWNDNISLRASTSQSYRYPSPFFSSNSYVVSLLNVTQLETGAELIPERTTSAELGARWNAGKKIFGDLSLYFNRTSNFISYNINLNEDDLKIRMGYINDRDSFAKILGLQSRVTYNDMIPEIGLSAILSFNYSKGKEVRKGISLDLTNTEDVIIELDGLRSQPNWLVQLDLEIKPWDKWRFLLAHTFMTSSIRQSAIFSRTDFTEGEQNSLTNPGFYTLDLNVNYQVNNQLSAFSRVNNLFNTQSAGIGSSSNSDGLFYNPQPLRFVRFGVNYRLHD